MQLTESRYNSHVIEENCWISFLFFFFMIARAFILDFLIYFYFYFIEGIFADFV